MIRAFDVSAAIFAADQVRPSSCDVMTETVVFSPSNSFQTSHSAPFAAIR